jgi:outer membrane protein assembly factor BamB
MKRLWMPAFTLAFVLLGIAFFRKMSEQADEPAGPILVQIFLAIVGSVTILTWFLFLAGMSLRTRLVGLGVLAVLGVGVLGSIRKVDLSGDLIPTLEFRWSPDSQAMVAKRSASGSATPLALPSLTSIDESSQNPSFRGLHRDGVLPPQSIREDWNDREPACLWRQAAGGGYSGFAVVGPLLFTLEQRGPDESLVAYEAPTGKEIWQYRYKASFEDVMTGDGPRATPTVHGGRVYSVGATSQLVCVDASTGRLIWHVDILAENRMGIVDCGMAGSPLLIDDLLVVHAGVQNGSESSTALIAYDTQTGQRRWGSGRVAIGYTSPTLFELDGVPQIVIFDKGGLAGHDPATGAELWRYTLSTPEGILAAQPMLLSGNRIFFSAHETCQVVEVHRADGVWTAENVWQTNTLKCSFASPILFEEGVYGLDKGILACIDPQTGERRWKKARLGHGQLLRLGDRLLVQSEQGEIVLVQADPKKMIELGRFQALKGKTWNMPALVDGILYVRNHHEMAAYDLRSR